VELARLSALRPDKASAVLSRLDAICRAGAGESPEALAHALQIGRAGFFKMRRRWEDTPSLSVLVPNANPGAGRPKMSHSAATQAHHGRGRLSAERSHPTLRRIHREMRRQLAMTDANLLDRFGRRFALDQTALDLPILVNDGAEWAAAAFLVELQSGLILSASVGRLRSCEVMANAAWASGMLYAEENSLRISAERDGIPSLDVVLGEDGENPMVFMEYLKWIDRVVPSNRRHERGTQRIGRFLTELFGQRLGNIRFKPRTLVRSASIDLSSVHRRSPVVVEHAQVLLDTQVRAHNAPIRGARQPPCSSPRAVSRWRGMRGRS
jgi:hypothetical protein